ncbi:peptidase S8/S53 domain-containing protein [Penicillium hispanicum]|uniref:peptidase S8/S53 domain-containing protein n=1 Tax=Penicillium hispanicum TaxID=1080232 RepID=UPI002541F65E|nr:peptidase S8/S53 domain-containing protein [Penicillium hispanicum]KAJ5585522.1 peptidase S8/S53 domain-containing protein [Penicillium hispanicum]
MLHPLLLPLLLALLQSIAGSPTFNAQHDVRPGWENEIIEENDSTIDDAPEYYYEDEFGNINTSRKRTAIHHQLGKRDGTVIRAKTSRPEVKFWSQAPGQELQNLVDFAFLDYAGSGVIIYVHDSGLNEDHPEFKGVLPAGVNRGQIKVLQPPNVPTVNGDVEGHGTCVADKAVGTLYGIAKSANLTMVPFADFKNDDYMLAELQAIIDDIKAKKADNAKEDKPEFWVVNLSYSLGKTVLDDSDLREKYREKYLAMVKEGALLTVAAGNGGYRAVSQYPALFAEEDAFKDNMIVVGGIDVYGRRPSFSQGGPLVTVWAPALLEVGKTKGIMCAKGSGSGSYLRAGTSLATSQVAGLAAYLYSSDSSLRRADNVAQAIKKKIESRSANGASYMRSGSNLRGIWNRESGTPWTVGECVCC